MHPLTYFSNSLRRVSHDTTSESGTHPLHAYIEPLLLSARASSEKYRTELNQILIDGGGAGEQEEMMMWYAREYEKATPNEKEKESDVEADEDRDGADDEDEERNENAEEGADDIEVDDGRKEDEEKANEDVNMEEGNEGADK